MITPEWSPEIAARQLAALQECIDRNAALGIRAIADDAYDGPEPEVEYPSGREADMRADREHAARMGW